MNLKIKLFGTVDYILKLSKSDRVYIGTSLDCLDTKDKACSITKIPISISNIDKILEQFGKPVEFYCSEADAYLYEWAKDRLCAPLVPKVTPFLDYIHPIDGDIFIRLEKTTFCFELVKITTFMECVFEDARKTPLLNNKASHLAKLANRYTKATPHELVKLREGTFIK